MNRISNLGRANVAYHRADVRVKKESEQPQAAKQSNTPAVRTSFSEEGKRLSFAEKSRILEEKSGIHVDENTPHIMSRDSDFKLSPRGEFLRIHTNGAENHEEYLKGMSEKYTELRDEILNGSDASEEEKDKQLSDLDTLFKTFLDNTARTPVLPLADGLGAVASLNDAELERNEAKLKESAQRRDDINGIVANFSNNMARYVDDFYSSFTDAIKENDFDTAFNESIALLKSSETSSYEDISYNDIQKIMDTMRNDAVEFDEDGIPTKYRYQSFEDALSALCADDTIPSYVRDKISRYL
jgi:DNA-binding ferritin-like protein